MCMKLFQKQKINRKDSIFIMKFNWSIFILSGNLNVPNKNYITYHSIEEECNCTRKFKQNNKNPFFIFDKCLLKCQNHFQKLKGNKKYARTIACLVDFCRSSYYVQISRICDNYFLFSFPMEIWLLSF